MVRHEDDSTEIHRNGCEFGNARSALLHTKVDSLSTVVAGMRADVSILVDNISTIKADVREVKNIINGNGGEGLVTRSYLNASNIRRLWTAVGMLWVVFVGACGFLWDKLWAVKIQ